MPTPARKQKTSGTARAGIRRAQTAAFKELLDQQAAMGEVLRALSRSHTDPDAVFKAIARNAVRLCGSAFCNVLRYDGKLVHIAANHGFNKRTRRRLNQLYPLPPSSNSQISGRVIAERKPVCIPDVLADKHYDKAAARAGGWRRIFGVPMLLDGKALGAIAVAWKEPGEVPRGQIRILEAFANQAVIAIENARLFNETREALERQTATADILKVISSSTTDTQPVFDVIVERAVRLCGARFGRVYRYDGSLIHMVASHGLSANGLEAVRRTFPRPLSDDTIAGQVITRREPFFVHDIEQDASIPELSRRMILALGTRSQVTIPMLRSSEPIGAITMGWEEPAGFDERKVELLKTFADQAVIAIENVRLFNETKEALERQTATGEILKVISESPTDTQPVFEAIVRAGVRLFEDAAVAVARPVDGETRLMAIAETDHHRAARWREAFPSPVTRGYMHGAAVLDCRMIEMADASQEQEAFAEGRKHFLQTGYRAMTVVPMVREGVAIGTISVVRAAPGPLSDRQKAMLQTFADQAVIAIENVRLFNELEARNSDLGESLQRQTATAEILRVISSTPTDTQPVFDSIVRNCTALFGVTRVGLWLVDGDRLVCRASTDHAAEPMPLDRQSGMGTCVLEGRILHLQDLQAAAGRYPRLYQLGLKFGYGSGLYAPLTREGKAIGGISVLRRQAGAFSEKDVALLTTFADQAVIAIENVRLFNETKEALERQTATAEILKVISSSTTDTQPVFEAIVRSAARLFPMCNATIFMRDGALIRLHAVDGAGVDDAMRRQLGGIYPIRFDPEVSTSARAMVERRTNICLDTEAPGVPEHIRRAGRAGRFRSNTVVPLVRDDEGIGSIVITHPQPGYQLNEKQLELLRTFADQAVIAIQNAKLFGDTKESLDRQTATAEVLKLISRTTFDLDKVLQTLLDNATRMSGAVRAAMLRPDGAGNYLPAVTFNYELDSPMVRRMRERPIRPGRDSINGRALVERRPIHVPDVLADAEYGRQDLVELAPYRTVLSVPMLRDGEAIGLLALVKGETVDPFTDKQIEVVTTFADQAVIAIENVRLFREIEEKSRQLEVANRHKSEFLANMSHELRTPLNAIIGFSEVLMEQMFGAVNEKQADYLKDIHESGRHLLSLINDILDLSKIEAGRMDLEISAFDLRAAISNAMTLVRERAQRHGVQLAAEVDPRLGEWRADERKVKQILLNLLSNAVKFTPEGGRVDVSAKLDTDKVEIAVKDTGVGISIEDQAKLFEEFRQVGADATRKAEGTGLGLALTKKFVELHGGEIRVSSAPGMGSVFTCLLPMRS